MKRIALVVALVATLLMATANLVSATDITVTATPGYISFSSTPTDWTLNDITGDGYIEVDEIYYANPLGDKTAPEGPTVADGECLFTWTNNSTVNIEVYVDCGSFTGGDADMTNGGTGSNGATSYGAYSWYSGMTYASKVVVASSGSAVLYTTVTPGEDKKWGAEIETREDVWTGGDASTATMTITALEIP